MPQKPDDLDALRTIITALDPFDESERERIMRWASEKLGIKNISPIVTDTRLPAINNSNNPPASPGVVKDLKSF